MQTEYIATCPACGDYIDYCQGHGSIGDPEGFAVLQKHDEDDHSECMGADCEAERAYEEYQELRMDMEREA